LFLNLTKIFFIYTLMKKYSEKFLHEYSKLNTSILGLEFEFYLKDMSYYKTLEYLNKYLSPVTIEGFRIYHPDTKPTKEKFILTPDLSGGANLVELITGPLPYQDAKYFLIKIMKFIQEYGYTTDKCSIHFNISFDKKEKDLNDLNILKLILNTNEDEVYKFFPSRKGNIYAKTVKKIIPYKEYDFFNIPINIIKNNLRIPTDKYYGINFTHIIKSKDEQRLEYRYIGGKDYEKNLGVVCYFLDRFVIDSYNCIDTDFNKNDEDFLENYLQENIEKMKIFSKYDNFIVQHPTIPLHIDQVSTFDIVNPYFSRIFDKLWHLIDNTENLKNVIINWVSNEQRMEIVDGEFKIIGNIDNYSFINCTISDGLLNKCILVGCEILNVQLTNSNVTDCDVTNSKVLNCKAENSYLKNCFFMGGTLNSQMDGGVYRSGELGPLSSISPETKIVSIDYDNFFNTKFDMEADDKAGGDKGIMKFKK